MTQHDAREGGRGVPLPGDDDQVDYPLDEADPLDDADAEDETASEEDLDDIDSDDETDEDLDDDEDDSGDYDDEDDEFDDLDDASEDEVDLVVALYREDGQAVAVALPKDLANDLDELINQLRRLPADAGAIAFVSIAGEFFVICRVRGRTVQVLLSDGVSANDWPIARDVADYLGVEIPDPDDDSEPMGDLALLADQGVSDFDLETYATDLDEDADAIVLRIVDRMRLGQLFRQAMADEKL